MGALAPICSWLAEDDLLLKNAVEAGASLESLAKGAVKFSRRFTIRELQDRWHSLLYDPDTSAEASDHMLELELSASNLSSKFNKFGVSKGNELVPGKRKEESIRSHYYAMRKRICTEPCSSIDLSFLIAPGLHNCMGNEGGGQEQLTHLNEHSVGNCMLEDPIGHPFEIGDADFDMVHDFPQMVNDTAAGNICGHPFPSGHVLFEGDHPDGMMGGRDCLYGFAENVSPVSVNEVVGNHMGHSFEQDNVHRDIPHLLEESMSVFGNDLDQEIELPQELAVGDLFQPADLKRETLCTFDPINDNPQPVCPGFGGNQDFSSPISDCGALFQDIGYSSPLSAMPIWRTPTMPVDENFGGKDAGAGNIMPVLNDDNNEMSSSRYAAIHSDIGAGDRSSVRVDDDTNVMTTSRYAAIHTDTDAVDRMAVHDDDTNKMSSCRYAAIHSETQLDERLSGENLHSSTVLTEGDSEELPEGLMELAQGTELYLLMDGSKDEGDRSSLDLFINSPNAVHHDDESTIRDLKAPTSMVTGILNPDIAPAVKSDVNGDSLQSGHKVCDSESNLHLSTSAWDLHPECANGVICCLFNTEDPEIPDNDDLLSPMPVLPSFVSSTIQRNPEQVCSLAPTTKDATDSTTASEQGLNTVKEERETIGHSLVSRKIESAVLPKLHSKNLIDDTEVKSVLLECDSAGLDSRHTGPTEGDPINCRLAPVNQNPVLPVGMKKELTKVESGKQSDFDNSPDFLTERPIHVSDQILNQSQNIVDGCNQEANVAVASQMHTSTHPEPCPLEMDDPESLPKPSTSGPEEELSENDDDVPYFSDIEAMILDMDLGPCDQDSYLSKEVSRYKHEDTKRAIVRLEQGANSYMKRAIASHRAFAVLCGRHLKHYIKKPEVLLGRATSNAHVDINLGKERCSTGVSRRQAIIKLEEDGSFFLKNLAKRPILVNNKEVSKGHRLKLSSSCMIEIRGLRLLFEVNQNFVTQYLNKKI